MEGSAWILSVFVVYFAVLIGIAILRARQMRGMTDYVLAGRRLGPITSALSSASSTTSGWTMLVFPALAFAAGMMHLWTVVGIVLGAWLAWTVLAKRLRRYTIATGDSLTIPEFLEKRFDDRTGILRALAAVITLYFMTLYVCSGLIAGAKLLDQVFELENPGAIQDVGVLITLIAIVSYTFIGGFLAVSRTDVFQAMIMLTGFFIIPVTLIATTVNPFAGIESTAPGFWNPFTNADNQTLGVMFFLSSVGWGLGALGSQRISARFMALERESLVSRSRLIAIVWIVLIFALALLMGLVSAPALAGQGVALPDAERLYIVVSETFFHPIVAGLLLTAVIAAVMSTADSQLLLASAIASDDVPGIRRMTYSMSADHACVDGTAAVGNGRRHSRDDLHDLAGFDIRAGLAGVGRNGRCFRACGDSGSVLAPVQSVGRADCGNVTGAGAVHLLVADGTAPRRACGHHRVARLRRGGEPPAGSRGLEREPCHTGLRYRYAAGDRGNADHGPAAR